VIRGAGEEGVFKGGEVGEAGQSERSEKFGRAAAARM
jgi:hypothetical protein